MDIKTFLEKYDSGGGYGWSCGDCGFNKAGNREIYPSEVKAAAVGENAYDEVTADFKSLEAEISKQTVAEYFKDELAYEVAKRLDPNYVPFRDKFDNGEGDGAKSEDDIYTLSEVNSKGGINVFKKEIAKLDPDLQIFVGGRMTDEVFAKMMAGTEEVFWATYDNGGGTGAKDNIIDGAEVQYVEGSWNTFMTDLKDLYKEDPAKAEAVLNRLRGAPPSWTLTDLKALFPVYTDPYNLKQFPVLETPSYYNTQLGLRAILKLTGKDVDVISSATLSRPAWALAVNSQEQFYMDLVSHLSKMPADYKMDVEAFGNFVSRNFSNRPRATLSTLAQGLEQNPGRYLNVGYTMNLSTNFDMVGDSYEDEYKTVQVSIRNKALIDELKGMRFGYKKGDSYYTFYIPIVRIEYGSLACDSGRPVSLTACMPMGFEMSFPEFEVSEYAHNKYGEAVDFDNKITRNKFSEGAMAGIMGRNNGLTVKAVKMFVKLDPRSLYIFVAALPAYSLELMLGEETRAAMVDSEVIYRDEYKYQPPPPPKPPKPPAPQNPPWSQDPEDPGPGNEPVAPGRDPSL